VSDIRALVNPKERRYYILLLIASALMYAWFGFLGFAILASEMKESAIILIYVVGLPAFFALVHAYAIGHIRGNGVRVSTRQFPELLQMAQQHATTMGLKKVPDLYVLQSGGMLNAFATRFLGRDIVVIYSDVLALAEARGRDAVSFIVAHELAHVRRGHLKWRWLIAPGRWVPYLGSAYSRACEYTCDRIAAHCEPRGALHGLAVLAAGRDLFQRVDIQLYAQQVETERSFWVRRAELISTHPLLPKRVAALLAAGIRLPEAEVTPTVAAG
jgi:Zn-dependent protease with chaperone function